MLSALSSTARICRKPLAKCPISYLHLNRYVSTSSNNGYGEYDIVIVGGGPVGLALASALASSQIIRENLKVGLIESSDLGKVRNWNPAPEVFSNRVSSLTNASQCFLRDIGAWNHIETERTAPIEEMQIWDGVSDARIVFSAEEFGLAKPQLGMARLTENLNLQRGLLRHLQGNPDIELIDNTRVQKIVQDDSDRGGWPLVELDNGKTLRTRLLVGADGFNSPVRAYAHIPSFGWSYDAQAIVSTMIHEPRGAFQGPNTVAYQRFLSTGPIAFLPLSPTSSSLVWSTMPTLAKALLSMEPNALVSMINAAFRLPAVSMIHLHNQILEAHNSGQVLTPNKIQQEIRWREESHPIDVHSAYASTHTVLSDVGEEPTRGRGKQGIPPTDAELFPPLVTSLLPGTVASFPLRFNHTESYIGEGSGARTVLVGDAAHTIHPLAGQGLNLGLADVQVLTECMENTLKRGGDIGARIGVGVKVPLRWGLREQPLYSLSSYTALLPYAQERYLKNHTIMGACDKLHKIYSTTSEPVVWARTAGVEVLNELDTLKRAFMLTAGAGYNAGSTRSQRQDVSFWSVAARSVETAVAVNGAARTIGSIAINAMGTGLWNLLGPLANGATPQDNPAAPGNGDRNTPRGGECRDG